MRAVVFDMDGLMLDTERLSQRAWGAAGEEIGHALPQPVLDEATGRPLPDIRRLILRQMGAGFPVDTLIEHANRHYHAALHGGPVPVKPGLLELLEHLGALGLPLAVATSTGATLTAVKLGSAGVAGRFAAIVTGDQVERGKPAPDIYLEAARRLGHPPAECTALEDSPNGLRAAHAAGLRALLVPDLAPVPDDVRALAHAVFASLHDVRRWWGGGGW